MAKVKVFVAHTVTLPREWADAAEMPAHNHQGDLVVTAYSKAEANALLADRLNQWQADGLTAGLRVAKAPYPNDIREAVEAGVLDPERGGQVYVWHNGVKNDAIVSVAPTGGTEIVARFWYDYEHTERTERRRDIYVHPGTEVQERR